MSVEIVPVVGIGEVTDTDDIASVITSALAAMNVGLRDRDVVVVTHKIVSKAEGQVRTIESEEAYRALVAGEAVEILRRRGDLVITKTRHGFICANAAVDRSNVPQGWAVLLPDDPDASAHRIRLRLQRDHDVAIGVVITDTFGRAWRRGLCDVAIGVSGIPAILDLRGGRDMQGRVLEVTEVAVADEIAAAADLAMGKASGIPVAIVRGLDLPAVEGRARDLVRTASEDMFR
ncbi:MAG: coenzyme F420-0:L-glutamate ligase [Acidimicrobiia bacterium]|nr:coenzyme F420-0:L-glutamate ligase [Acidimicrobiia bacterium]NNF64250.1 coenzyme F420-0:L-glutamate ligase [Acidimicrobiia bacterium]